MHHQVHPEQVSSDRRREPGADREIDLPRWRRSILGHSLAIPNACQMALGHGYDNRRVGLCTAVLAGQTPESLQPITTCCVISLETGASNLDDSRVVSELSG